MFVQVSEELPHYLNTTFVKPQLAPELLSPDLNINIFDALDPVKNLIDALIYQYPFIYTELGLHSGFQEYILTPFTYTCKNPVHLPHESNFI